MTTKWKHAQESLVVRWCMAPGTAAGYCACLNPTPDPKSPCGVCWQASDGHSLHPMAGGQLHDAYPTLCLLCGHAVGPA